MEAATKSKGGLASDVEDKGSMGDGPENSEGCQIISRTARVFSNGKGNGSWKTPGSRHHRFFSVADH